MGKASGNGMGPAFQVFQPFVDRSRVTKAEAAEQRRLEEKSAEVRDKLHRLSKVSPRLDKLVREAKMHGSRWLEIAEDFASEIREAERREAALKASRE